MMVCVVLDDTCCAALRVPAATVSPTPALSCLTSTDSVPGLLLAAGWNSRRLALPGWGELNMSAAEGPVGEDIGSKKGNTQRLRIISMSVSTQIQRRHTKVKDIYQGLFTLKYKGDTQRLRIISRSVYTQIQGRKKVKDYIQVWLHSNTDYSKNNHFNCRIFWKVKVFSLFRQSPGAVLFIDVIFGTMGYWKVWVAILAVCWRFGNKRLHYARLRFVSRQGTLFPSLLWHCLHQLFSVSFCSQWK